MSSFVVIVDVDVVVVVVVVVVFVVVVVVVVVVAPQLINERISQGKAHNKQQQLSTLSTINNNSSQVR